MLKDYSTCLCFPVSCRRNTGSSASRFNFWIKKVHSTQYLLARRYVVYVCLCISMEGALQLPSLYHPYHLPPQKSLDRPPYIALGRGPSQWSTCEVERLGRFLTFLGWLSHLFTGQMTSIYPGSKGHFEWSGDQFYLNLSRSSFCAMHKPSR